jgi:hypothetical protein
MNIWKTEAVAVAVAVEVEMETAVAVEEAVEVGDGEVVVVDKVDAWRDEEPMEQT